MSFDKDLNLTKYEILMFLSKNQNFKSFNGFPFNKVMFCTDKYDYTKLILNVGVTALYLKMSPLCFNGNNGLK